MFPTVLLSLFAPFMTALSAYGLQFLRGFFSHGRAMLAKMWQGCAHQIQSWSTDPLYAGHYRLFVFVLTLVCLLLTVALLYYVARCVSKTVSWTMWLAFRLITALLFLALAMCIVFVFLPWVAQTTGLSQWVMVGVPDGPSLPKQTLRVPSDGMHGNGLGCTTEEEEEEETVEVTVTKLGNSLQFGGAHRRWGDSIRAITGQPLPDLEREWEQIWASRGAGATGWLLWSAVQYGVESAGRGLWAVATNAGGAGWTLVGRLVHDPHTNTASGDEARRSATRAPNDSSQ